MVTQVGDQIYLDNLKLGATPNPEDPNVVYMGFTDIDNEKTYIVPIAIDKIDAFFDHVKRVAAARQIEIAGPGDMPQGGPQG